jgi:hypothetical protein
MFSYRVAVTSFSDAYFHKTSMALILTDKIFNVEPHFPAAAVDIKCRKRLLPYSNSGPVIANGTQQRGRDY